jgi:hypothetical protein
VSKKSARVTLWVGYLGIWLAFSVFLYVILLVNQQNIFSMQVETDVLLVREYIGWELGRQTTWAVLMIFSFIGIFSSIRLLRDYGSNFMRSLLSLIYFGFALFFIYCILKLFWSYQIVRMYEAFLGKTSDLNDLVQIFLFAPNGKMKTEGAMVVPGFMGLIATLIFQIFQFIFLGERKKEEPVVEKAREFLEEKPVVVAKKGTRDLTVVKGIGPKASSKLKEAGIKDLDELVSFKPEEIAAALGVSYEKASKFIENARSLLNDETKSRQKKRSK